MNKMMKWGLGFLAGVMGGNLIWLFVLHSPHAAFFTPAWWERWSVAYGVALAAVTFGAVRQYITRIKTE